MKGRRKAPIISNLQQIIANKEKRNQYTFRYNFNGENYYIVNDQQILVDKFNSLYPVELKHTNSKGKNSDRTRNWINGDKSY